MEFVGWEDGSVLEAASWRLASELCRRHSTTTRLGLIHPGGGQYDCLCISGAQGRRGQVMLNRNGTIQIIERFDDEPVGWEPVEWDAYLRADPYRFLLELEAGAGLVAPPALVPSTATTVTLRVLAAMVASTVKARSRLSVAAGYTDTAGPGGGVHEEAFAAFPRLRADLRVARADDVLGIAECRYWFILDEGEPLLAFEQSRGQAWTRPGGEGTDLLESYRRNGRDVVLTAYELLRRARHG